MNIFIAFWNRDWSFSAVVGLPFIYHNLSISGYNWFRLSILQEYVGYLILIVGLELYTIKNRKIYLLFPVLVSSDIILWINYKFVLPLSLFVYGLVWNGVLYFVMIPITAIIVIKKSKK